MLDTLNAATSGQFLPPSNLPLQSLGQSLQTNPLANGTASLDEDQARKVAEEFESFFLSQMMGLMFQGLGTDPMFGGGPGEQVFQSLMVQEYATVISRNGGVGLSDAVTREILRLQEAEQ